MSLNDRYYIFNYLKSNSDINKLLITDAQVPLDQAKLIISDDYLEMKVETEKPHFKAVRENLLRIIDMIEIKEVETSSYISLFSDFTAPLDGHEIRN
jgi:hypothetical protein